MLSLTQRAPYEYFAALETHFRKTFNDPEPQIAAVRSWFAADDRAYQRHVDFRMRYFRPQDVSEWAECIRPVIPRALDQMASWALPIKSSRDLSVRSCSMSPE